MAVTLLWRGAFTNEEVNALHAEAFQTRLYDESEWNWVEATGRHSLGWVTARDGEDLAGFVNVLWDGGGRSTTERAASGPPAPA